MTLNSPMKQNITVDNPCDLFNHEWWHGSVIYQIYPRSFMDSNGDGIGDLPGIISKLDYIASLGVDGIWISPFFTSPMRDFGYDVSDYCNVDKIFGTLDDFDLLIERAHKLGLKVIIDQVYSHTSDQHNWFAESRASLHNDKADWYVWADPKADGSAPNNWLSVFGGTSWTWDARRRQYYFHNFLSSQPDLNLHNPDVQDALLNVARFWLDRGVDGFRLDAINFGMHDPELKDNPQAQYDIRPDRTFDYQVHKYNQSHPNIVKFLERLRALTNEYEGRFTLAEIGGANALQEMKLFTQGDARLNSAYSFDFLDADYINAAHIQSTSKNWPHQPDVGWPSWAFSNHDAPRYVSRWYQGENPLNYAKMMALIILTLRGNAILYQGEELGLPQADVPFEKLQDPEAIANWPRTLGRDGARTPMPWTNEVKSHAGFSKMEPWLPVDHHHYALCVENQDKMPKSALNFHRQLIKFRAQTQALRYGDIKFLDAPENILAFLRRYKGQDYLIMANMSDATTQWTPDGELGGLCLTTWDDDSSKGQTPPQSLKPHSAYISRLA